jgi:hypothetical protein
MGNFIVLLVSVGAGVLAHAQAKRFVRSRLRFVDAAHRRRSPIIAGLITTLVLLPVAYVLPVVTWLTALAVGVGVSTGVSAGSKSVRLATYRADF